MNDCDNLDYFADPFHAITIQPIDHFGDALSAQLPAQHIGGLIDELGYVKMLAHYRHVCLDAQIVDLVRLGFLDDTHQIAGICQIAIVLTEIGFCNVRVLVDMADCWVLKDLARRLMQCTSSPFPSSKSAKY